MRDPFVGTWKLNPGRSNFDPNHRPTQGTMVWELRDDGRYEMRATGISEKGEPVTERPQIFIPDGKPYPIPDFPGLSGTTTLIDERTIRGIAQREDGSLVGEGTFVVSADGQSLSATAAGFDTQLRRFETRTEWDRVS